MSRDDPFLVRHRSIPQISEANADRAIINNFGAQVVIDLVLQWLLSGFCFHMQTGTEDAPITTNGPLDPTKPIMVADNSSGVMVPLRFEANISAFTTETLVQAMLEADMGKVRYSSGGTVFVPKQLNGAATSANAANGIFYTIEGSDIVAAAKTAVPGSVEFARRTMGEDAIADPGVGMLRGDSDVFNIRRQGSIIVPTPGSILAHFGSATADVTGYGVLEFAQFSTGLAW